MKNIINLIKFCIKDLMNLYVIEIALMMIFLIMGLSFGESFSFISLISAIPIIIIVNFVFQIIHFSMDLSSERGKLLFLTPITPLEFLIGKYLEFIITQGIIVLFGNLIAYILVGVGSIQTVNTATFIGFLFIYVMITLSIMVLGSFTNKTWLVVIGVFLSFGLYSAVATLISYISYKFLPYVYLQIGDILELALIPNLIELGLFIGLVVLSVKRFKKFDII